MEKIIFKLTFIVIIVLVLIFILILRKFKFDKLKKIEKEADIYFQNSEWDKAYSTYEQIQISYRDNRKFYNRIKSKIQKTKYEIRRESLNNKYSTDIAEKLLNKHFFIGMSKEQLIDSMGEPHKIEIEALKTKTKEIWIYGNKSSGDIFIFENDILSRFKDR